MVTTSSQSIKIEKLVFLALGSLEFTIGDLTRLMIEDSTFFIASTTQSPFSDREVESLINALVNFLTKGANQPIEFDFERAGVGKSSCAEDFVRSHAEDFVFECKHRFNRDPTIGLGTWAIALLLQTRSCSCLNEYMRLSHWADFLSALARRDVNLNALLGQMTIVLEDLEC